MPETQRGEVWLVDLGLAAKVRPCLVLSVPVDEQDRAFVAAVAHTTSPRGSRFEVAITTRFLRPGCLMRKTWLRSPTQSYSENWVSFPQHNLLQWKRRYGSGLVFSLPTALSLEGFCKPGAIVAGFSYTESQ